MKVDRKVGEEGANTRAAILAATESIMREEGYAAVSSRRVAERAGLNAPLIHYHFGSMDDLFLALYVKAADEWFAGHLKALTSDNPLKALWEFSIDQSGTELVLEFIALANHKKSIRQEMVRSAARTREVETAIIGKVLESAGVDTKDYPPEVITFLIAGASRAFVTESMLGISAGHPEVLAFMDRRLAEFRTRSPDRAAGPQT